MQIDIRGYLRSVTLIGAAAALVVAGVALAQGGSETGSSHGSDPRPKVVSAGIAGPVGPEGNLTYAEFHVIDNGQAKVVRLDAGKVVSASDSSITIGENDGNQVTIPVDGGTQVIAGPEKKLDVTDLRQGQRVSVPHSGDGAATAILLPPKFPDVPRPADLPSKGRILRHAPASLHVFRAHGAHRPQLESGAVPPTGAGFAIVGPPPRGK
jgi:hypothetical protein